MRIKEVIRKARFSRESIYLYAGFKNRGKFEEALRFHELRVAIIVGVLVFVCQVLLLILLGVI